MLIMKKTLYKSPIHVNSLFILAFILLSASCNDRLPNAWDSPSSPKEGMTLKTFKVEIEPLTKTVMNPDGAVKWLAGDQVSVFDNKKGAVEKPAYVSNNTVTAEVEASATRYFSIYPYNKSSKIDIETGGIYTVLNDIQAPLPGKFDRAAGLAYAETKAEDEFFSYKNVCAFIKFSIADEEIESLRFEGLSGERIAGAVVLNGNGGQVSIKDAKDGSVKSVKIFNGTDSPVFIKDKDYYFSILPQTLQKGFKATLTKKGGAIGVYKHIGAKDFPKAGITDIGALKCAEYRSDLHAGYVRTGKIEIAGVTYSISDMPAYEVSEAKLSNVLNGSGKDGIYFLDPENEYDISSVNISGKVVLVGNDALKRAVLKFKEDKSVLLSSGELVLSNVELDNSARSGSIFVPDKNAVKADFVKLAVDKSKLTNVHRALVYYDAPAFGIETISFTNNKIEINLTDKDDIQLFNIWKSKASSYKEFKFSNNIYYSKKMTDVQIFNASDKIKKPYSSLEMKISNNIIYNIHSSKSMVKASIIKSLAFSGNLFYASDKKPNDYFRLYGSHQASAITGGGASQDDKDSIKNFAYVLEGFGWTNYGKPAASRVKYFLTQLSDSSAESPFEKADPVSGGFKLKGKYSQYGPQN